MYIYKRRVRAAHLAEEGHEKDDGRRGGVHSASGTVRQNAI